MDNSSFSKDSLTIFSTRAITLIITTISSILVARTLGPSGKGILTIVLLVPSMAVLLGNLGINIANIYYLGRRRYSPQLIVGNSLFSALCIGAILSIALTFAVPILTKKLLREACPLFLYIAATLPIFLLVQSYLLSVLLAYRDVIQISSVRVSNALIYTLSILVLLYVFKLGILGALIAYVGSLLATLCLLIFWLVKKGYWSSPVFKPAILTDTIKFGLKGHLGTIFQYFNYRLDMFLVAYFLNPSAVGQYAIAVSLAELIWYIPDSISQILFPKTAFSDEKTANSFTPIVCRNTALLTFLASILLFAAASFLIPFVFSERFSPAVLPLRLLLPGVFALGIWKIIVNDLAGRGLPQYKSYGTAVSLVITILLDILLIPRLGISGAAIASSVAYIVTTVLFMYWFLRVTKLQLSFMILPRSSDAGLYVKFARSALKLQVD